MSPATNMQKGALIMPFTLPDKFDPYDMVLKQKLNTKADEMNFISVARKAPYLACGCKRKGKICKSPAGFGTPHLGYGRCKNHGGLCTGPKTPEGKARSSQNNVIHGLYRQALTPKEQAIYDKVATQSVGLEDEIALWKAKIIVYLTKKAAEWKKQYESVASQGWTEDRAEEFADNKTRVYYSVATETEDGEFIEKKTHYYNAGTIEDKPLIKALETLSRLVDKHAKLNGLDKSGAEDILEGINKELRAASQGQVNISWGGKAQRREDKK
jgi:hypothetical protein